MRSQEGPRFPDEAFYFEGGYGGELVVDQACLDGTYPSVDVYEARTVIGAYENTDGRITTRNLAASFYDKVRPGERLLSLQTSDQPPEMYEETEDDWRYRIAGEPAAQYTVQPADVMLATSYPTGLGNNNDTQHAIPATDFLPPVRERGYKLQGIVTENGQLVAWAHGASGVRHLVDLAIANTLVRDPAGLYQLTEQVGSAHLAGLINCSDRTRIYLQHYAERFGKDFMPDKNPRERWNEFPQGVSREVLDRYRNW